jgi:hypothetical protein
MKKPCPLVTEQGFECYDPTCNSERQHMRTIDAANHGVNGQPRKTPVQIISEICADLRNAMPGEFASKLQHWWINQLADMVAAGDVADVTLRTQLVTTAANRRATCQAIVEEFCRQYLPQPRTIGEIKSALLFAEDDYQPQDAPEELIKSLLPRDGVTIIGGQSGAGKTFAMIAMALALATGQDFMGKPVRERVGVIIAAAEGEGTISPRLEAAKRHAGIVDKLPIATLRNTPHLDSPEAVEAFGRDLQALARDMEDRHGMRVGALFIDTVASAFAIQNERDNSEVANICKHLAALSKQLGMAVIPIHHFGKDEEQGLRGASAWRAHVDHALSITMSRDGATGKVISRGLNVFKSRTGEEGPVCGLELIPVKLGTDRYGDDVFTCAIERTGIPERHGKGKKLPTAKTDRLFSKCYDDVAISKGRRIRVRGDGPEVIAVSVTDVRSEFYRRRVGESNQQAMRQAWKRALERALDGGAYAGENDPVTGVAIIWDTMSELPLECGQNG